MRLDDFVCLGRTVPEDSKKYGHKVCMAGYSEELNSLIRVYPLMVKNPIRSRHLYILELGRNHEDNRPESWKLSHPEKSIVSVNQEIPQSKVISFLRRHLSESIIELNERRMSLGVLEVNGACSGYFRRRSEVYSDQPTLFDFNDSERRLFGAEAIDIAPYLGFQDKAGYWHDLQLREWGCYEWCRKNREEAAQLWANLNLSEDCHTLLVVGNMIHHRNVWLVIKVFKDRSSKQVGLF